MRYREHVFFPYYPAQLAPLGAELENSHKGSFGWIIRGVTQGDKGVDLTVARKRVTDVISFKFDQCVYVHPYGKRL